MSYPLIDSAKKDPRTMVWRATQMYHAGKIDVNQLTQVEEIYLQPYYETVFDTQHSTASLVVDWLRKIWQRGS